MSRSLPAPLGWAQCTRYGPVGQFGPNAIHFPVEARFGGFLRFMDPEGAPLAWVQSFLKVATPDEVIDISAHNERRPRIVICEQGPQRIVVRVQLDLRGYPREGNRYRFGEALTEWTIYRDHVVFGVVAFRLINADGDLRLQQAHVRLMADWFGGEVRLVSLAEDGTYKLTDITEEVDIPFATDNAGVWLTGGRKGMLLGLFSPKVETYAGGKGAWHRVGDGEVAPYYEDWGTQPDQGWGDSGWDACEGATLHITKKGGAACLEFVRTDEGVDIPEVFSLRGQLMIVPTADERAGLARLATHRTSKPIEVHGGHYRGYAIAEGAHYVYAPDAAELTLTVPPADAPVAVHIYGLSHWGGWTVTCDGERIVPQLVNDGRGTDDPNGMQLGRFDDRFGPIIGRTGVPANRMILLVPPGGEPRTVKVKAVEGLAISYLHWDDRQMYLIQSSANPRRNIAELHVRDGKLRRLVAPHSNEVSVAAMPLYWYQCNAPTSYYATDEVTRYVLTEAGPEAIAFEVHSRNKYGCAEAVYRVRIPFDPTFTRVEVNAELDVKKTWRFKDLQILNLFTEEFRDHRLWPHESALAMHAGGGRMLKRPREGKGIVDGEHFSEYTPPLLYAQYTAERGNIFLAQTRMAGPVACRHLLCRHWIDSHYHIVSPTGKLEAGDAISGGYSLLIDDGRKLTTAEAEAVGRAVIAGKPLTAAVRTARG